MSQKPNRCNYCDAEARARCQNCRQVYYCTTEHQKKDWKAHKAYCQQISGQSQQTSQSQNKTNSISNKDQTMNREENGNSYNIQLNQKIESYPPNQSILSSNTVNQSSNNQMVLNPQSINYNQSQVNQTAQISASGNNKASKQSNNAVQSDSQTPQASNSHSYQNNNQNNMNQNNQSSLVNNMVNLDNNVLLYFRDPQKDLELQQLMSERLAFRSEVVKLLAKFNYSEAINSVKNLCKTSEDIYKKKPDLNELQEMLADQLLEVKILIKSQSTITNREAVQKLQDIFQKIKQKMSDNNAVKNYYQDLQFEKKNEFMNEIRKRCNLISLVANLFYSLGYQNECEEAYVRYVKLIENVMGQDALETSNCYFLMGVYYLQHRYYIKALACFKRSMSIRSQRLTERHESVTDCQYNIGIAYKQLGKKQKALDQLEKTLFVRRQIIGQSSLPVAQTLEILGKIYMESPSDYPIALDKFQECYLIRKSIIKSNKHPDMVRISLLIVHLYNLIKAQLALQETSQPSKQAQQLKEIEQKMQKNVIDGNIQQYIQTQKNNPDKYQELQNQYGLQNNEQIMGTLNQVNMNNKQQSSANSQTVLPDNSVDELMKNQIQNLSSSQNASTIINNSKLNLQNNNANRASQSIVNVSGINQKKDFYQHRQSAANNLLVRDREGSKQSQDSNSPNKTIQEEETYSPPKKSNQQARNQRRRQVSEEISEDEDMSDEDIQDKNIKKNILQVSETTLARITHQQFKQLVDLNERICKEMKKDPKFNPKKLILESLFVQSMKEMDYKEICQDLLVMNRHIFNPEDFYDQKYLGPASNELNSFSGNGQSTNPYEKKIQNQSQFFQQQQYQFQQQSNFQNFNNESSFGRQDQYQQNTLYSMPQEYSFPQNQQKPRPEINNFNKWQEEKVDMQMDPNEDYLKILQGQPNNRSTSRDSNQYFGEMNNNNLARDFNNQNFAEPQPSKAQLEENSKLFLKGFSKKQQ